MEQGTNDANSENQYDDTEDNAMVGGDWQTNNVAGSFILYAMLNESQFLKPFLIT